MKNKNSKYESKSYNSKISLWDKQSLAKQGKPRQHASKTGIPNPSIIDGLSKLNALRYKVLFKVSLM